MRKQLQGGQRAVLCSILESDGSTPREAGAKMAVFADGSSLGTVGGGAIERLAIRYAAELLREGRSGTKAYCLRPNPNEDIGMVCGGDALLGFECFFPEREADLAALEALETALDTACRAWLKTAFYADGTAELAVILREDVHDEGARLPNEPRLERTERALVLLEPIGRDEMVYIFGGGHVCAALVPALAAVDFPVTVYDERPEFAAKSRFPAAKRVVCAPFADVLSNVRIRPEDYVVVMTPGHKADFEVLCQALKTDAGYIGCIGSAKKAAYVSGRLRDLGFSDEDVARVHSPIGLPILAQTPEEIAVSITAQMIRHRRGGR